MMKKRRPIPTVVTPRIATATAITKVYDSTNKDKLIELDHSNTEAVSASVYEKIKSNEEILNLFPDVEISIQILVSSILSPNDLTSSKVNYSMDNPDIPNNINAQVVDIIDRHISKNYDLNNKLSTMLREALFTKGGYAELIVPDTDINRLQNVLATSLSTESMIDDMSYQKYLNLSNTAELVTTDNKGVDTEVTVTTEDLGIDFVEDLNALRVSDIFIDSLSTEAMQHTKATGFKTFMRKKKVSDGFQVITTDNTTGSPMCMKLPIGSVLPIHLSNDPSKHISYLVLIDDNGVPVSGSSSPTTLSNGKQTMQAMDIKSSIITKTAKALKTKLAGDVTLNQVDDIYTKALVASIRNKVNNGMLGSAVSIPAYSDMYQTVFARALKGLKTRLLFVPKTNLTYFAFEYRENGTGKSLLEKSVMLFSIRAANLFTRIMANTKNSVNITKVTATLDEADPDPAHTRELIMNQAMQSERVKYPMGLTNVNDLVDWMHNVGYRFDIKHPALPNIDLDVSDDNRSVAEPDTDFDEMIQEHIIMSFGLKKDIVMSGYSENFATGVVANNILLAKRVMEYSRIFSLLLSEHVRKILLNDGILTGKIKDVLLSNVHVIRKMIKKSLTKAELTEYGSTIDDDDVLIDYVYSEYTSGLNATLPQVSMSNEDGSLDGLDAFTSMLDTYLPMIISSDTMPADLVGDISDKMDDVMSAIKTVLIKNWMEDRNVLPELSKFLTLDNTGASRYDILGEYTEFTRVLSKAVIPYLKTLKKDANVSDDKLVKIDDDASEDAAIDDTSEDAAIDDTSDDGSNDDAVAEDDTAV